MDTTQIRELQMSSFHYPPYRCNIWCHSRQPSSSMHIKVSRLAFQPYNEAAQMEKLTLSEWVRIACDAKLIHETGPLKAKYKPKSKRLISDFSREANGAPLG